MRRSNLCFFCMCLTIIFFGNADPLCAQTTMPGMAAMENSVGFLSSGTSVEPKTTSESAPVFHTSLGNWTLMFHANGFVLDAQQTGPRGTDKLFWVNWLMPMLSRDFGRHTLTFRTMFSLEPATVTDRRYPELFQSGETAYGLPTVDGQHRHELFMDIAGRYSSPLAGLIIEKHWNQVWIRFARPHLFTTISVFRAATFRQV